MHKSATKCNETLSKWCKNKHGASKIIGTLETYQVAKSIIAESEADTQCFSLQNDGEQAWKMPENHEAVRRSGVAQS
jgi:hypothetical protein